MSESLLIGIDGGGTECRARLCDASGNTLGEGFGGPANARLGGPEVMNSIMTASRQAAAEAGLSEGDLSRAYAGFGLAGANLPSACEALLAEPNPFVQIEIETDAYAAWLGAFEGEDGAILIMGTGSCGLAIIGGVKHDVGGWGAEVSDEASGQWIGREAVRRTLWAYDGRAAPSGLTDAVLAHLGGSAETIVAFATTARPTDFAALVPLVLDHAAKRDPLARALLTEAAADAVRFISRLFEVGAPAVALIGGLAEPLSEWMPHAIRAELVKPRRDPLHGAVLMARRALETRGSETARAG